MPNDEGPRHLITDAAQKVGIASAIFDYDQQHNLFLPLRYTSHPLRGSQTNYSQFALEAFALIKGVKENIDLIMYTPCYIYTDCQSLVYLVRMRYLSTKAARWLEFLSGFNIKVVFLPSSNALLKKDDFRTQKREPLTYLWYDILLEIIIHNLTTPQYDTRSQQFKI